MKAFRLSLLGIKRHFKTSNPICVVELPRHWAIKESMRIPYPKTHIKVVQSRTRWDCEIAGCFASIAMPDVHKPQ